MAKTLMAVDAGTGSVRAVLFSLQGEQLGCVQKEWTHREDPRYPGSMDFDWTHNWELARSCIREVIAQTGVNPADIAAVSTTCARASSSTTRTATKSGPAPTSTRAATTRWPSSCA